MSLFKPPKVIHTHLYALCAEAWLVGEIHMFTYARGERFSRELS